jgi:NADH dehydrogenase
VELADGRRIPTRTIVWVTGIKCNPVVEALPVPHGKGGTVVVNEFLQVEGRPEVFALGDNAWCLDPRTRRPLPPDAKIAVQQAEYVARNVAHAIRGEPLEPFEYRYIGEIIPLGNFNAVAEVYGFKLAGFPAWVAWRLFYLNRLQGLKNRVRVVVDWLLAFVFPRDTSRLEQPAAPPEHVAPVTAARTAASAPPPRPPAS